MSIHLKITSSLKDRKIVTNGKEYRFVVAPGRRLDLPREDFFSPQGGRGTGGTSLLYADAILVDESDRPRVLVDVVTDKGQHPNGIVGLVINLDRLARLPRGDYSGVDLLFIVAGQIRRYWCSACNRGHYLSGPSEHFSDAWRAATAGSPVEILHAGLATNYRKALLDYPIAPYLRTIRVPSVLFLNSERIMSDWRTYETIAAALIDGHVRRRLESAERNTDPVFEGLEQLLPESVARSVGPA